MSKKLLIAAVCAILLVSGCGEATPMVKEEYQIVLDAAWQVVNDNFYDPFFGGKDWEAIGEEYRQKLSSVQDDETFLIQVLNPMLFELGVSHMLALPLELANEIDAALFFTGSMGMDVRLLNDDMVIVDVEPGSPAETAGLQPGFVITELNEKDLGEYASPMPPAPPHNERRRRAQAVGDLSHVLYGEPGTSVTVDYLDAHDQPGRTTAELAPRPDLSCGEMDPSMPAMCAEIHTERLSESISYLRISAFLGPVKEEILQAIDELRDAPAVIIDIRGNPGGEFHVRTAVASKLVGDARPFMRYQMRDKVETFYLEEDANPYQGEVVILVDELSASSSEEFSASLQYLDRATIVGAQTQGNCLVMALEVLPEDMLLMYPYKQSQTPDARIIEGNGVVPDIEVALDRASLLEDRDVQLEAAIAFLEAELAEVN